jgi:hypothetical protein
MQLDPAEVIVGSAPKNTNGVRNKFIDVHVEILRDANIPARIATLSEVGPEHKPQWAEEKRGWGTTVYSGARKSPAGSFASQSDYRDGHREDMRAMRSLH